MMSQETEPKVRLRGSGTKNSIEGPRYLTTYQLLTMQYGGMAVIPVEKVCCDYFNEMTADKFMRKVSAGEIRLPIVRMYDDSHKAAKAIPIDDLADYLDKRIEKAKKEFDTLYR